MSSTPGWRVFHVTHGAPRCSACPSRKYPGLRPTSARAVAAGICIRLYDEEDFNNRAEYTEPEILRTNLASVILQMDSLRVGHIRDFEFIEPPDNRLISDGYRLLHELKAVKPDDTVTRLGKMISRFPLDPRLARMLIRAADLGCHFCPGAVELHW